MIKKLLLLTLTLFTGLITSLYAQSPVQVGVKGGLLINKSDLNYSNSKIKYDQSSTKPGFEVGLQFRLNLPLGFMIQPEFVYSRVNGEFAAIQEPVVGGSSPTHEDINIRSNWIEVPVLLGWKFSIVRLMAGPSFRFPMSEVVDAKNLSEKVAPRLDNFVMGYQAGIGVDLGRITIDARYCGNFTNITDDGVTKIDTPNFDVNDNKFALTIGYMILK